MASNGMVECVRHHAIGINYIKDVGIKEDTYRRAHINMKEL